MAKRIVAVTGEYEKEGQQKAEFTNIGIIGVSDNGKEYVLLDPSISLSGVLAKQNALAFKRGEPIKDMVMSSVFDNSNDNQNNQQGGFQQQPQQQGGFQNNGYAPQQQR